MENIDYRYLCTVIGNLAGIPVRIFRGGTQVFYHSVAALPKDPMCAYREQILAVRPHVGYFITPHFHYYGVVAGEVVSWATIKLDESLNRGDYRDSILDDIEAMRQETLLQIASL